MKIKIEKKVKSKKGLLVVPISKKKLASPPAFIKKFLKTRVNNKEFKGKKGETLSTYLGNQKILIIGTGKSASIRSTKELGGKIGKHAKSTKSEEISLMLPENLHNFAQSLLEGLLMSQYEEGNLKSKKKKGYCLEKLHIITDKKSLEKDLKKAQIISEGVKYTKDLVNKPSNLIDAAYLAHEAKRIAKENKYKVAILTQKQLEKEGWGLLLAVNQGSEKEAKCLVLQYDGAINKREKPAVIIGKGIVFDTGGYNLKPTNYIETMQQDMAGGAVVLGLFEILKKLHVRKNVIGIIPVAENLIGKNAYRPSDIIQALSGLTVEITNTDAEGRLVLADAITYATKFKPASIITIATLTGAVGVALGDRYAGLISNDIPLRSALQKAGSETDELAWPLPLHHDYKKKIDSKVADIKNYDLGSGRYGGCSKAAAFLERFVEKNKWCHVDIGGTAFSEDPKAYQGKGATAHGLQLLLKFLES